MGMPGWAMALGAPLAVDKLVVDPLTSVFNTYKGIRDDMNNQADEARGLELMKQFAANPDAPLTSETLAGFSNQKAAAATIGNLSGIIKGVNTQRETQAAPILNRFTDQYQEIAGTANPRFFDSPENRAEMVKAGLEVPNTANNPYVAKGVQDFAVKGQQADALSNVFAQQQAGGRISPDDLAMLAMDKENANGFKDVAQGVNSGQTSINKSLERAAALEKEALVSAGKKNISDFQGAISGLTSPSQSPSGLARFAARAGYAPIYDVESDIRNAAAAYNVGDSDEVGKAITEARGAYKDTLLPTEAGKVGRTSYTGQRNLMGDFKKDAQSTAPVIKVNIPNPRADRKDEFSLRKEFLGLPEVKEFPTIEANSRRAIAALKEKGSKLAVDQTIITTLNKMLDPTSVVRESEYARTPQDMAVLSRIKGKFSKMAEGGAGLDANERLVLARMINNFSSIASQQYNDRSEEYKQLANDYGFDHKRVVARRNGLDADAAAKTAGTGTWAELKAKRGK